MNKQLKIIGVIGARSGSKGVSHKNIRFLAGKPLIAWIIEAAKKSKYLDRVLVSTDSEEYAKIAREHGAETPFLRPKELASDASLDFDYVSHAVNWLIKNENYKPDIVVRLMPTIPFQRAEDMDFCIEELLKDESAESSVVIAEARQHPQKALKISENGGKAYLVSHVSGLGVDVSPTSRQKYEKAYFRANVVASRMRTIEKYKDIKSLTGEKVCYHIIPQERALDIDSEIDFAVAEILLNKFHNL